MRNFDLPALGAGIGLRTEHYDEIRSTRPDVGWFEVIPENFLGRGGYVAKALREIAAEYKCVAHGVGLSIGSTDPLDRDHLARLRELLDAIDSPWYSDHLCFTMVDHVNLNDLIPLPFTEETIRHVAERSRIVQDILERPLLLENVTYYAAPSRSQMGEAEFITRILEAGNCGLLLDVTNVCLNAKNQGYDPIAFIDSIPLERVGQMHLAGYEDHAHVKLDTHSRPVSEDTWALYREVLARVGRTSALVEWDVEVPSLERLLDEQRAAQRLMDDVCAAAGAN
ncbi:MAG: DUF692 domain-containing protein [Phycisphaerales bacterium]|nr:DUF692 domain-containing protein [Phycisphaerales bacterium]